MSTSPTEALVEVKTVSAWGRTALAAFIRAFLNIPGTEISNGTVKQREAA